MRRIVVILILIAILSSCNLPSGRPSPVESTSSTPYSASKTPLPPTMTAMAPVTWTAVPTATRQSEHPPVTSVPAVPSPTINAAIQAPPATTTKALGKSFGVQAGTPVYTPNFVKPEAGCNWMGVAGQVFGKDGAPINGLLVQVEGKLGGKGVSSLTLTGGSSMLGPGGFDITLSDHLVASKGTLFLQLLDLNNVPKSPQIPLEMIADCNKNQVLINFVEIPLMQKKYFPLFYKESKIHK